MTKRELRLYAEAGTLAEVAMGKTKRGWGKGSELVSNAADDPLAWWCLTEAIVGIAKRHRTYEVRP